MYVGFTTLDLFEDLTLSDFEYKTDTSSLNEVGNIPERNKVVEV